MKELIITQVDNGWMVQDPEAYGIYVFNSHWDMSKFIEGYFATNKEN